MAFGSLGLGCSYGGVATVGDKVVVGRNDNFLQGALRHLYVCKASDKGLSGCSEMDTP
ncbi:MAG: hypothetical protein ACXWOH_13035 [Bdellovibrionota bacterium]